MKQSRTYTVMKFFILFYMSNQVLEMTSHVTRHPVYGGFILSQININICSLSLSRDYWRQAAIIPRDCIIERL